MPPSVRRVTRLRNPLSISTWWTSASPSSHALPAFLIDENAAAPVPPSWPLMRMMSACALAHAGRDGADTRLGHQLDADPGPRVDLFQIEDQLRQILDGVDIVVRRRRDEHDPGVACAAARAM